MQLAAPLVPLDGDVSASGTHGGTVAVQADAVIQSGAVTADGSSGAGGAVVIDFGRNYVATTAASLEASGAQGGQVSVTGGGRLFSSGSVTADGGVGGQVTLTGQDVVLDAATVDASGTNGGGSVVVGGVPRQATATQTVTVTAASVIHADAGLTGAGGQVLVWSNQETDFAAVVSARGGTRSGAGGLIEASSAGGEHYSGQADASAANGPAGQLLLDPKNLVISAAGGVLQVQLINPGTGAGFGGTIVPLSTGNVVVVNAADGTAAANAGAVYLFNGQSGALIAMLTGSASSDSVGGGGVTVLTNGNYVIDSPSWKASTGAVTLVSGSTGKALADGSIGPVTAANSLVGSSSGDQVGGGGSLALVGVTVLSNGNYVVDSPSWNASTGAVTLMNGSTGKALADGSIGRVTSANSLVGSNSGDQVGSNSISGGGLTALSNGNCVIDSPGWRGGTGAVTLVSGSTGKALADGSIGLVSIANSLVGGASFDTVGSAGVTVLSNGNFVVASPSWSRGTGAATLVNGSTGMPVTGASTVVSAANSVVGGVQNDSVGGGGVTVLSNGNYVIDSPGWRGSTGAVTLVSGNTGAPQSAHRPLSPPSTASLGAARLMLWASAE